MVSEHCTWRNHLLLAVLRITNFPALLATRIKTFVLLQHHPNICYQRTGGGLIIMVFTMMLHL